MSGLNRSGKGQAAIPSSFVRYCTRLFLDVLSVSSAMPIQPQFKLVEASARRQAGEEIPRERVSC